MHKTLPCIGYKTVSYMLTPQDTAARLCSLVNCHLKCHLVARLQAQWLYERTRNDSFIVNVTNGDEEDLGGQDCKSVGC